MLIKDSELSSDNFKKVFEKKFITFCEYLPLYMENVILPDRITIYAIFKSIRKKLFTAHFDFEKSVKQNIHEIHEVLLQFFPTIIKTEIQEKKLNPKELNEMVLSGKLSLEEAPNYTEINSVATMWRIEKIYPKKDEIRIRNLTEGQAYSYHINMPSSTFIKNLHDDVLSKEDAGELFFRKATLNNDSVNKGVTSE